jgi:hypothetical protein
LEFTPKSEEIVPLIKAFNLSFQNYLKGYKSKEVLSLREAIWNLEAGINFEYRSVKDSLQIVKYDSTFVLL